MSFASMGSGPRRKKGPRPPGAPATGSLSANDVALAETRLRFTISGCQYVV